MENTDRFFDVVNKKLGFVPSSRVLRLDEDNVEILNGPDSYLEDIQFSQNIKTKNYDVNSNYDINEVSEKRANEIINNQEKEWGFLREYMSSSEDRPSKHLNKNTMRLY